MFKMKVVSLGQKAVSRRKAARADLADIVFISMYSDIQCFNIRRMSAYLKSKGYRTKIIFLPNLFSRPYRKEVISELRAVVKGSRFIGLSLMTNYFRNAVQVSRGLRSLGIPIIWGGSHVSISPEECLDHCDYAIVSNGEEALLGLLRGDDIDRIPNLVRKSGSRSVRNRMQAFRDVDSVVIPDFDLQDHHVLFGNRILPMTEDYFRYFYGESYVTHCTFGCPFGCAYCCNNFYNRSFGLNIQKRRIENVISELAYIKRRFSFMNRVEFDDDLFFLYPLEEIRKFSRLYRKEIGLPLSVFGAHPSTIKRRQIGYCVRAGMDRIRMGIQSGCERTQRLFKRNVSNEDILRAIRILNGFKRLSVEYDFIIDNPWESEEDVKETLRFMLRIPHRYQITLFSLTLFKGTELHEKALRDGIRIDEYDKGYYCLKDNYYNSLFSLIRIPWFPESIKARAIDERLPWVYYFARAHGYQSMVRERLVFLIRYLLRLDLRKTLFILKRAYYNRV